MNKAILKSLLLLGSIAIMGALAGCKVKRITERSPLVPLGDNALRILAEDQRYNFEYINAKLNISTRSGTQSSSFKANLRAKADSALWMSITPALGIEAARILIDRDSVRYINKVENEYYLGDFSFIDSILDYPVQFDFLTNILTGNPVEIEQDEKYNALVEGLHYVLQTKNKRKLRKSIDPYSFRSDSAAAGILKERKLLRAVEKYSDDDLIVKRYYIRPGDFRVERTYIDDLLQKRSLRIFYSNFEMLEGKAFPMRIVIEISSLSQISTFELSYTRIKLNEPQTFPFKIPEKYKRVY